MKKILVTRKLLQSNEERLKKLYDVKLNSNDELYSQKKLIEISQGYDGILSSLTDKLDADTIKKLPKSIKILSNFAVGYGNIDIIAAKKRDIVKNIRQSDNIFLNKIFFIEICCFYSYIAFISYRVYLNL